ncbi:hypothetical protein BGX27_005523 [Mortierella sp. AM989]|nr:hypothetical protein BGX27_005523 [Mortierella sp. AM989]
MARTTSIFEIPILLDVICDNLSPKDIWNCYRSSQSWKSLFDPYRSRVVQYAYLNSTQTSSIIHNSHQIRNLKVDLADAGHFLGSACINLLNLVCIDFGYTACNELIDPAVNALELISRNPKLQSLTVQHRADTQAPQPLQNSVLKALSIHRSLRSITLDIRLPWEVTREFLSNIPPKLEELTMKTYYYVSQHSDPTNRLHPLQLNRPTALRRITMLDEMSSPQHYFLPSLLEHSPELEEISIPYYSEGCREIAAILRANCPKLRALNQGVYINPFYELTIAQLLITAFPNGIRRLVLGKVLKPANNQLNQLFHILTNNPFANTLEVLEFKHPPAYTSGEIVGILQSCTRLRELRLAGESTPQAKNRTDISDIVSSLMRSWKCQDSLEVLELNISNLKEEKLFKKDKIRSVLQQRTAHHVRELYDGLRSMKNLNKLTLNWKSSSFHGDGMPLETGLAYANEDWGQATSTTKRRMTKTDLAWMGLNWRPLYDIQQEKGLKKMEQAAVKERAGWSKKNASIEEKMRSIHQIHIKDQDWPLSVDQKRYGKSGYICSRKSLKNNRAWFQKGNSG